MLPFQGVLSIKTDLCKLEDWNFEHLQELQEAMKEKTMQMVVVRKGQLKLYAGQPFSDVELALQSLVEESPSG